MFKKRTLLKKFFIIPFAIMFIISFVAFYFLLNQAKPTRKLLELFQSPVELVKVEEICGNSDVITYLTYKDIPLEKRKNNKFGLYIYAENNDFMELAQNLVNSNGGDWGYVLIPYNVKDRDRTKWRGVFERLRNKHLIPIIQLWDITPKDYKDQTRDAADFLDSFVWPIRQRYISGYNEPNDAKFWYGEANPEEYARILDYTLTIFNDVSSNFFILNGALNVSASAGNGYIDAFDFMRRMDSEIPGIFSRLDGWASHSYPQPNFRGSPHTVGRNGIRAHEVELEFLRESLGVKKDLPVFITETGWAHAEGTVYNSDYLSVEEVGENFQIAYEHYWLPDNRVRAVMPFTIWYKAPFDHFSWVNADKVPYKHYEDVKSMGKVGGNPESLVEREVVVRTCK